MWIPPWALWRHMPSVDHVTPQTPVDDFRPPYASFAAFFAERDDVGRAFLVELNHAVASRRSWTVGSWRDYVRSTATWLAGLGVAPGDAVATLAGNTAEALVLAYGCWVLGACVVPLNPGDSTERQQYILKDAAARLLVHADESDAAAMCGDMGTRITTATTSAMRGAGQELTTAQAGAQGPISVGIDVPAVRIYTSGTTGQPKGVVLTIANLLTDCDALVAGLKWPPDTTVLTVLPVHHVNGLVISSLLPWYARYQTVLCDRFRSERFWADATEEAATVCSVVPSLLEFLLATPQPVPPTFREFLCGAGPLLAETVLDFEARFLVPVRHLYGLSETTAVATLMPSLDADQRTYWHRGFGFPSIGLALPHVEVAVLDDAGNRLAPELRGELVVRGGVVMQGYASDPASTHDAFRHGWFHSGDEGFWAEGPDAQPFFFITGRIKELIIRGGTNISPFEIDTVLRSHSAVRYGLAVPFANRYYGEEIAAYVVRSAEVSEEEILAHCANLLDFARCPKVVIFGDHVPYTATGKPKRLELKQRLSEALLPHRDVQFRRSRAGRE